MNDLDPVGTIRLLEKQCVEARPPPVPEEFVPFFFCAMHGAAKAKIWHDATVHDATVHFRVNKEQNMKQSYLHTIL